MRSLLLLSFIFLSGTGFCNSSKLADELWSTSISAIENKTPRMAIDSLEKWITLASEKGVKSSEAHHNLGVAYYQSKDLANANYHLIKSIHLRTSPFSVLHDLSKINEIQKQLGIKNPITDRFLVQIALLTTTNTILIFFVLGFWLFVAFFFLLWRKHIPIYFLPSLGAAIWISIVFASLNRHYWGGFGVLNGHGGEVHLFRVTEGLQKEELLTLPSGTLVSTGKEKDSLIQVLEPFSGWVNSADIQLTGELLPSPSSEI